MSTAKFQNPLWKYADYRDEDDAFQEVPYMAEWAREQADSQRDFGLEEIQTNFEWSAVRNALHKRSCVDLRSIARHLHVPGYHNMKKPELTQALVSAISEDPTDYIVDILTDEGISQRCKEAGIPIRGTGLLRTGNYDKLEGLICALVANSKRSRRRTEAYYEKLRNENRCDGPNQTYPTWNASIVRDCPSGYRQEPNVENPYESVGACCVKITDYVSAWEPDKVRELCDQCVEMSDEQKEFFKSYAENAEGSVDDIKNSLSVLGESADAKFTLKMVSVMQKQMVKTMGERFDEMMGAFDDAEDCDAEVDKQLYEQTPWLGWGIMKGTFMAVAMVIKKIAEMVVWLFKWGAKITRIAVGKTFFTLKTLGEKLAFFIVSNPQTAKIALAAAHVGRMKLCRWFGKQLDESNILAYLDKWLGESEAFALPDSKRVASEIAEFTGTEEQYQAKQKNMLTSLQEATSGTDLAKRKGGLYQGIVDSITGKVETAKTFGGDVATFVGDVNPTGSIMAAALKKMDLASVGSRFGGYAGRMAGSFFASMPGGGAVGEAVKIVGEITGEVMGDGLAKGLEVTVYYDDVFTSLDNLGKIFDLEECLSALPALSVRYPNIYVRIKWAQNVSAAFTAKARGMTMDAIQIAWEQNEQEQRDEEAITDVSV
jgi:hypothetical protein